MNLVDKLTNCPKPSQPTRLTYKKLGAVALSSRMSASPPTSDLWLRRSELTLRAPQATSARLFDHLVGGDGKALRHSKPKGFGSLEVNDELDFRNLLNW
jgi:hypothetical protein